MFFNEANTLDPRIIQQAEQLSIVLNSDPTHRAKFNRRFTTDTDPPMLEMFHSSYRTQCLFEVSRLIVHRDLAQEDGIKMFFEWLPALVSHYHATKGHDMVVAYATARTKCVDDFTREFLSYYLTLLIDNGSSVATGASKTGGMGVVSQIMYDKIKEVGAQTTKSRVFGVRLGFTMETEEQSPVKAHHHAPPLYIFALRMYYLNLIGGSPDAECVEQSTKVARRNRLILPGGLGSWAEALTDLVELQTSKFAHTTYSHVLKQEIPYFVFVGPSANALQAYGLGGNFESLAEVAKIDNEIIERWKNLRTKAIQFDEAGLEMGKRLQRLNPDVSELAGMLPGSGLFYRGLLLQLADGILNATISARELLPVEFVCMDTAEDAAKRVFELHNKKRLTIEELHSGGNINFSA